MNTPARNQIGTPLSKFEDSPVFNYINSLSPINTVESVNISQTFNSLSFAAISSVFTSPQVQEFRFLRRHQSSCQHKCGNYFSKNGNQLSSGEGDTDALQVYGNSPLSPGNSLRGASFESHGEHPNLSAPLSQSMKFDCGSPEYSPQPCCSGGRDDAVEVAGSSASLVPSVQEDCSLQGDLHLQEKCQSEEKREESGCDWESSISDAADLLILNSPDGTETFPKPIQKPTPGTNLRTSVVSECPQDDFTELHKQYTVPACSGKQQEAKDPSRELKKIDQAQDSLAGTSPGKCRPNYRIRKMDDEAGKRMPFTCKPVLNLHRVMRRRCLLFEMAGAHGKNSNDASNTGSSHLSQSGTPSRILSGIGLHLNSLTAASKGQKIVMHAITATESQLMSGPSSSASFHSPSTDQEQATNSLDLSCSDRDKDPNKNGFHVGEEDILQTVELNQSNPTKKRRKWEEAGEPETCKRCNCKKSKCLKLYCECFSAGVYCVEPCSCQECLNKPIHEDTVLATRKQIESRNPLAFAPKVIRNSDSVADVGDEPNQTPASARHKRGCNCKKSNCLKKYCECYQGGVGCSIRCRCEGCKNAFGRKDGSAPLGTDVEPEEEETKTGVKNAVDQRLQNTVIQNNEEQNLDSVPPFTPLQIGRPSAQLPFFSRRRPLRSSSLTTRSSSVLHVNEGLGQPKFLPSQPKFEKHSQIAAEDAMPDILRGNCSPSSVIKTASPSSKRVSPLHCDFESSSGLRSSLKLILRSIPPFPSLTQD